MIRCVGAALRGDGNPPEVPVIRTVLRAYNGVWECPHQAHECRTLCAQMPCLPPNDFAKQSIVSYIPGGALIKDGLRPVYKCALPYVRGSIP